MKQFKLTTLIFFFSMIVHAQSTLDSNSFARQNFGLNNVQSNFLKLLTTYNLNTQLNYGLSKGNAFFGIQERFNSTIIDSRGKSTRKEQHLSLLGDYYFSGFFSLGGLVNNSLYSDDRKFGIYESSLFQAVLFSRINLLDSNEMIPYFGYSANKQIGTPDRGAIYGLEGKINISNDEQLNINSIVKFENEDIIPRRNELRNIKISLNNVFEKTFSNNLTLHYSKNRKDFYIEADTLSKTQYDIINNIQTRSENNYLISDQLVYSSLDNNLLLDLNGYISWRNITRSTKYTTEFTFDNSPLDNKIEEFKLNLDGSIYYKGNDFDSKLRVSLNEKEEKYFPINFEQLSEITFSKKEKNVFQKNNNSVQSTIAAEFNYQISMSDKLSASLFHRKVVYDTPSELNFDDRDELLSILRLKYSKKLSPFFNFIIGLEGSINHIVYIFGQRSSNNNIKRVLKLESGGIYYKDGFYSSNFFELIANYTVFDFEDELQSLPSYSFRQLGFRDTTFFDLTKTINLTVSSYLRISEQGSFSWESFSSKPTRLISNYLIEPMLNFHKNYYLFGIGMRIFKLSNFTFKDNFKKLQSNYQSIGPVANIKIEIFKNLSLNFHGLYEIIFNEENLRSDVINMNLDVDWNI